MSLPRLSPVGRHKIEQAKILISWLLSLVLGRSLWYTDCMSTISVEVVEIASVTAHPNADRLDLITFKGMGWQCVSQRGKFQPGQRAVYFPIDSVLPDALMQKIFSGDGKTSTPSGGRIRTIRLRGLVSQGLVVRPEEIGLTDTLKVGTDLTETLGVKKYEAPQKGIPQISTRLKPRRSRKILHEAFSRFTDLQHFQKHAWLLKSAHEETKADVVGHCKLHGVSSRYGWLRRTSWWDRFREWLGFEPRWVFLMGSRNVDMEVGEDTQIHASLPSSMYSKICREYGLQQRIPKGYVVYGEIIGDKVQKGYGYGHSSGQMSLYIYDVKQGKRWLDDWEIDQFCKNTGLKRVACVYRGPYDVDAMMRTAYGPDPLFPMQKVREGVVFRLAQEYERHGTRLVFKYVSPDFLLSKAADEETADK